MKRFYISLLSFLFFTFNLFAQNKTIDLTSPWQFKQVDQNDWMPATVPGNVFIDLLNNKRIKDPFYADQVKESRWVETKNWEYKTNLLADANLLTNRHIELIFEGLDTHASVYVNGTLILKTNNMFRIWQADIKKFIRLGNNELKVVFESAVTYGKAQAAKLPYVLPEEERIFSRKAQFQFGWDFAPRFVGCGIWKAVKLCTWNDIKLNSVHHEILSMNDSLAKVNLIFETQCDKPAEYSIQVKEHAKAPSRVSFISTGLTKNFKQGRRSDTIQLAIKNPTLWWCNGMGEAFLYEFFISLQASKERSNKSIQNENVTIGLRKIELIKEMDDTGVSFNFELNGTPVFMKGANYIPDDIFLRPKTANDYEAEIDRCNQSHMNMLRIWGGGIYPDDLFYAACDKAGILVWQDLMFACAMYPGDTAFLTNVKEEVTQQVARLRKHPSLALWCGNNEIDEGWNNWGWQKQFKYSSQDSTKIWKDYETLFQKEIPELIRKQDVSLAYWPSSPSVGWGHKESLMRGDSHYWGVWWGMEPFEMYQKKTGRFMTEYGFQSLPALSSFQKFCPDSELKLNSASVMAHQKHAKGFQTIQSYLNRAYKTPATFENYIYVSQLLQRDGMQVAIESHRRNKPLCMGTLFWQLNDCWPAVSWSAFDYYKQPKAFYYALDELYNTRLISITHNTDEINIHVISDSIANSGARLQVKLLNYRSEVLWQKNFPTLLSNHKVSVVSIARSELAPLDSSLNYLKVELNSRGETLASQSHFFTSPQYLKLPKANIQVTPVGENELEISSDVFAKDVFIFDENHRLLLSHNFFNLEAGQKKRITIKNGTSGGIKFNSLVLNNL